MNNTAKALLLAASILTPSTAFAQDADASQERVRDPNAIPDIIVTARKVEESVIDAPAAITVFSGELLQERGLNTIDDIGAQTPGLSFSQAFGRDTDRPVIRGLSNVLAGVQFGVESGVAIFIDGALFRGDIQGLNFDTLERVEIVKGPQSALYGRNTYSGAINFITRTPGDRFSGTIRARAAEYDEFNVSASLDIPIVEDIISARVDGRYYEYGGQFENSLTGNLVGQEESTNVALTLYVTPNDRIDWRTRIAYEQQDDGTPALFLQGSDQNNCSPGFRSANYRGSSFAFPFWPVTRTSTNENQYFCGVIEPGTVALNNETVATPFRTSPFAPFVDTPIDGTATDGYYKERWFGSTNISAELNDAGWMIDFVGAYRNELSRSGTDSDHSDALVYFILNPLFGPAGGVPDPAVDNPAFANTHVSRADDFSAQLRLTSPEDASIRGLAGLYFYDFQIRDRDINFATGDGGAPFGGAGTREETVRNYSAFARLEADLTDTITLGVEGRYLEEIKSRTEFNDGPPDFFTSGTIRDFVPRVTLDWDPSPDTLVYAIYTEGNKPGGTNGSAGASIGREAYLSETLWGGEIGIKQTLANGRVQINAAAFYNELSNVQLTTALPAGGGALRSVATNQGDAEVLGFELELTARPVPPLTLSAGVAYNDATFTNGCDDFQYVLNSGGLTISDALNPTPAEAPLCSIAGNRLPLGSPWQANGAIDFRQGFGAGDNEFFANVNGSYEASKFVQVHNLAETGETFLLNARAGVNLGPIELAVFGRNLTDEDSIPLATRWFDLRHGIGVTNLPPEFATPANGGTAAPGDPLADRSFPRAFFGALRKGRTFGVEATLRF